MNPSSKFLFILLLAFAVISGNSYNATLHYEFPLSMDAESYFKVAQGDYDVYVAWRYRFIVPGLARLIAAPIKTVYAKIWPHRSESNWPLRMGFLLVNSFFMALFGAMLYYLSRAYGAGLFPSMIGMIAILTTRISTYVTGVPMADSVYLLAITLTLYALKTENRRLIILAIFLGPLTKEAYVLILPLIFFYSRIPRLHQIGYFILSGALVLLVRQGIDFAYGLTEVETAGNYALTMFGRMHESVERFISIRGIFELSALLGAYYLIIFAGLTGGKNAILTWVKKLDHPILWLMPIALLHALIASDIIRMLFVCAPSLAVIMALILDHHPFFQRLFSKMADPL